MTAQARKPPPQPEPAVLLYQVVCLAGLGLVIVPRLAGGVGLLELFLVVVGLLGVLTRWRLAPVVVLGLLAVSQLTQPLLYGVRGFATRPRAPDAADLLLCCGVLAYVAAHYRLQGLLSHILPPDPRNRVEGRPGLATLWRRPVVRQPRAPRLVTPAELSLFVLSLPLWAVLAQAAWVWLAGRRSFLGLALPEAMSRFLLLAWLLGAGGLAVATLLGQWRRRTMTPAEGELLLQDVVWRETRREQRRLGRWLAWSRLRRARKETP
jgi:hypothetical protein